MSHPTPYLSARQLRERGWTDRLIQRYLPNPDHTEPNPYRRHGLPKRLYLLARVEAIEAESEEFRNDKARSDSYSGMRQAQSDAKRVHLEELVHAIALPELRLGWHEVVAAAREKAGMDAPLARAESELALEFLLDTMKSLDWHLDDYLWHSGIRGARKLLRQRMLAHITHHYPGLAEAARKRAAQDEGNTDRW